VAALESQGIGLRPHPWAGISRPVGPDRTAIKLREKKDPRSSGPDSRSIVGLRTLQHLQKVAATSRDTAATPPYLAQFLEKLRLQRSSRNFFLFDAISQGVAANEEKQPQFRLICRYLS
jgi:hypothetical protein